MSKYDIFGLISHVKIGFLMSKYDIQPDFECQNRILNVKIRYSANFECQNLFFMSKYDILPYFECQNRILHVKIRYSASV